MQIRLLMEDLFPVVCSNYIFVIPPNVNKRPGAQRA